MQITTELGAHAETPSAPQKNKRWIALADTLRFAFVAAIAVLAISGLRIALKHR